VLSLQAKKKPIKKLKPEDLGLDFAKRLETINVAAPPPRKGGAKVSAQPRPAWEPRSGTAADSQALLSSSISQVDSVDEVVAKLKVAGVL